MRGNSSAELALAGEQLVVPTVCIGKARSLRAPNALYLNLPWRRNHSTNRAADV
jgi:hypothetical protein